MIITRSSCQRRQGTSADKLHIMATPPMGTHISANACAIAHKAKCECEIPLLVAVPSAEAVFQAAIEGHICEAIATSKINCLSSCVWLQSRTLL